MQRRDDSDRTALEDAASVRLSVVIPATNDPETLDRCLLALEQSSVAPHDVICVRDPHLAIADARNRGADRATGDIIVFLDADVLVHGDALERIQRSFERDRDLVAIFGAYDDRPASRRAVSTFRNLLHHHLHGKAAGEAGTFWTGLGAVRRTTFQSLGGFEGTRLCWPQRKQPHCDFMADVEFGMRLVRTGHRVLLDPRIQGTHLKVWNIPSMVRTDFFARGVPWTRLMLSHRQMPATMNLSWSQRLSAVASTGVVAAAVTANLLLAASFVAAMIGLNLTFYRLLLRRGGPVTALAAVGCHLLYYLTAIASIITGLTIHLAEQAHRRPLEIGHRRAAPTADIGADIP